MRAAREANEEVVAWYGLVVPRPPSSSCTPDPSGAGPHEKTCVIESSRTPVASLLFADVAFTRNGGYEFFGK